MVGTPNELFLALHYKSICLWELDAEPIVKHHIICLYTLLPAMKGAGADLLQQALREMSQHYTRQQLGHRLIRFQLIMRRTRTMSEQEKQKVEEELRMQYNYDYFIDENPLVQERIEKAEAKAIARGEAIGQARGEARGKQNAILSLLNLRFPALEDQAQSAIHNIQDLQQLETLFKQMVLAADEQEARLQLFKLPTPEA